MLIFSHKAQTPKLLRLWGFCFAQLFCRHNQAIEFGYFIEQIRNRRADDESGDEKDNGFERVVNKHLIRGIAEIKYNNLMHKKCAEA